MLSAPRHAAHLVANVDAAHEHLARFKPDVLLISGTPKVGDAVLATATIALNLHHGFVPLYWGVSSSDWATLERNFNYYVVTVHVAVSALDAGKVVSASYVTPYYGEPWWLFHRRLMLAGATLMVEAAKSWPNLQFVEQPAGLTARNFRHKDKHANHSRRVEEVFESSDGRRYAFLQKIGLPCRKWSESKS